MTSGEAVDSATVGRRLASRAVAVQMGGGTVRSAIGAGGATASGGRVPDGLAGEGRPLLGRTDP